MDDRRFPQGFVWGAATSSHQTEGGNLNNDWSAWEQAGRVPAAGVAADSWNRWREDLDVACAAGLKCVRISAEWSRVEPRPGVFDEDAIAHYAEILSQARARGLQTMLVLWHFTNPLWMTTGGGWLWEEAEPRFAAYARKMAERLGGVVDHWVTLNEPNMHAWSGYVTGDWPPGRTGAWLEALRVLRSFARAHRAAREAIKDVVGERTSVALTYVLAWPHPVARGGPLSRLGAALWRFLANDLFLDGVMRDVDWLGVQYYHDWPVRGFSVDDADGSPPRTDMGWRIEPRGLYEVVMRAWRRYGTPMMVTENGLADAGDVQRARFLVDHLAWLARAVEEGADVRGYLHWALIDNYEWTHGFGPRFGLAEIDYETGERRLRPSARLYREIVERNGLVGADGELLGRGLTYADGSGSLAPQDASNG